MRGLKMKLFDRLEDLKQLPKNDGETRIPLAIFIGYDPKEHVAAEVLAHSIRRYVPEPLKIVPVCYSELRAHRLFNRPLDKNGATEFTLTRFAVPMLAKKYLAYDDIPVFFMDCDMLVTKDLFRISYEDSFKTKAISVCKHDYKPRQNIKMWNTVQAGYPRKNWSSFVMYNMQSPALGPMLNRAFIERASARELHRYEFLKDDEIGSLPLSFNYLVGETQENEDDDSGIPRSKYQMAPGKVPANIHYTYGTPNMDKTLNCEYSDQWYEEFYLLYGRDFDEAVDIVKTK